MSLSSCCKDYWLFLPFTINGEQGSVKMTDRKVFSSFTRPEELGLIPWEQAEAELDAREGSDASLG
jgi:hypothetical protein